MEEIWILTAQILLFCLLAQWVYQNWPLFKDSRTNIKYYKEYKGFFMNPNSDGPEMYYMLRNTKFGQEDDVIYVSEKVFNTYFQRVLF